MGKHEMRVRAAQGDVGDSRLVAWMTSRLASIVPIVVML